MANIDKTRPLEEIEIKLINLQIRNESWSFWIRNIFLLLSGIFAFWVYYDSTRPQTTESMNRERAKFMWEVKKEKNLEDQAYGWKLIQSVYKIKGNDELKQINKESKEEIDSELEIKKQELRRLIEKSDNPVDKRTYELRLETLEKLHN